MDSYFSLLGLSTFETELLKTLSQTGPQPASVISLRIGEERTKTYRHLEKLTKAGFIRSTDRNGVRAYFLRDTADIERRIDERISELERLKTGKSEAIDGLKKVRGDSQAPEVTVYSRSQGMGNIFDDMERDIRDQGLLSITLLATNTYFERGSSAPGRSYAESFFSHLAAAQIHMDVMLASGGFTMERIVQASAKDLSDFPAGYSTLHVFLIGKTAYLVTYADMPQGIKIENETLGDVLHLLLDSAKGG